MKSEVNDFKLFLKEKNITNDDLIKWMQQMDVNNLIEIKSSNYYKSKSNIQGDGLFASKNFKKGDYLGIVVLQEKRTTLSRFVNHSDKPNIEFIKYKNKEYPEITAVAHALKSIKINKELLVDYRNKKLI